MAATTHIVIQSASTANRTSTIWNRLQNQLAFRFAKRGQNGAIHTIKNLESQTRQKIMRRVQHIKIRIFLIYFMGCNFIILVLNAPIVQQLTSTGKIGRVRSTLLQKSRYIRAYRYTLCPQRSVIFCRCICLHHVFSSTPKEI